MPLEINYYDLHVHKLMLYDGTRCESFRRALADTVTPGAAVLDVGAGTGLLSIFAAQAGARVVYAVERTKTAALAQRIIADNGCADRIQVIQDDMEHVELPEPVDVIVSEWLGGYGIDENLLPVVVQARDRWLKPCGSMLPARVSSWLAPAYDEQLENDLHFWRQSPYGLNLTAIGEQTTRQLHCCRNHVQEAHLLATPQPLWEIDAHSISLAQSTATFSAAVQFTCSHAGRCNALAAWFEAQLRGEITLSNRPSDTWTHWGRWIFPLGRCLDVEEGQLITANFSVTPGHAGQSTATWQVSTGNYTFSSVDITQLTR